jgi:acetate kinase
MILTVNIGSSSARLGRHDPGTGKTLAARHYMAPSGTVDMEDCLSSIPDGAEVTAICHRIVHAGPNLTAPAFLDARTEQIITAHEAMAPLHNPAGLRWYRAAARLFPDARQIAVFDTGLYADLPAVAARYAIPEDLSVRRLGFHGLAHRAMLQHVQSGTPEAFARKRIITLQLGSGCSVTASRGGKAVDTSMGYTPLEGLMMSTRSGDVDPGLILHLLSQKGRTADALGVLLGKQSGLLGVSGISGDMQELLASDEDRAALAVDMFCYPAQK